MANTPRSSSRDFAISEAYAAMNHLLDSHTIAKVLDGLVESGHIHYADQCECAPLDHLPEPKQTVIRDLLSQWEPDQNGEHP